MTIPAICYEVNTPNFENKNIWMIPISKYAQDTFSPAYVDTCENGDSRWKWKLQVDSVAEKAIIRIASPYLDDFIVQR